MNILLRLLKWVFLNYVSGFGLKISRILLLQKRFQLDSKNLLTTNGLILVFFCLVYASFHRLHIRSDWKVQELLRCYSFSRHKSFSKICSRVFLVCSLNVPVHFSHSHLYCQLISFSIAMQLYFLFFCVFQSSSPERCDGLSLSLLLKTNLTVFQVSYFLSLWCSTSCTVINVLWKLLMSPVNALARRWPSMCLTCVFSLERLGKTWTFWEAYMSLNCCSKTVGT